nr:hypothetical protein [Amylibacter sp.]
MTATIIDHPSAAIGRERIRNQQRAIFRALSNARIVMANHRDHTAVVIKDALEVLNHFGNSADQRIAQQRWDQIQRNSPTSQSGVA